MVELAEVRTVTGIWQVETGTHKIGYAAWGALALCFHIGHLEQLDDLFSEECYQAAIYPKVSYKNI
jgi:hypothetical protein